MTGVERHRRPMYPRSLGKPRRSGNPPKCSWKQISIKDKKKVVWEDGVKIPDFD